MAGTVISIFSSEIAKIGKRPYLSTIVIGFRGVTDVEIMNIHDKSMYFLAV